MSQVDYDALAAKARTPTASAPVDYDALASKARGSTAAPTPPSSSAAGDFLSEATQGINPRNIYHALKSIVLDLPGTVKQIGQAQGSLFQKAEDSYQKGDYIAAARHMVNYVLPILGPRLDQSGDYMQQGQYAKGLGVVADIGVQTALPAVTGKVSGVTRGILKTTSNPVEASAVAFGESRGIPVDAGTKTGIGAIKNTQKRLSGTLGGATPLERSAANQAAGLERVGYDLAADANARGAVASPVTAGESVRGAFTRKIQDLHGEATTHYDAVRAVEADPARAASMQVDLRATKAALKPTYDRLAREAALVPLQGGKAKALTALDRIMNGPDTAPLTEVDSALGDLKSMARGADMPELRTGGQAVAAQAVQRLDSTVRATAARAGRDVLNALERGRAATSEKYAVADALDLFSEQGPAQVYKQLTATKDLGLQRIRAVQKFAPDQLPTVARAYLEDAMDLATEAGKFDHADKLYADWQKMGAETKRALFPQPGQIQALDDFFLLGKKLTENRNPSGTANVANALNATQLLAYFPAKWTALLLTTPRGVRALTSGLRLSMNAGPAAQKAAVLQVVRAAQAEGIPLPAAAEDRKPAGASR